MEITRATEYAVRCVLHLALEPSDRVVPRREIARARQIPEQFLGKIAQRLARAGIIRIHQGARGGYVLTAPPRRVTLLDVVEAGEGPLSLNKCVMHPKSCARTCVCAAHRVWSEARRQLRDTLGRTTFADLAGQEGRPSPPPDSSGRAALQSVTRPRRRGDAERGPPGGAEAPRQTHARRSQPRCSGTRSDRGSKKTASAHLRAAQAASRRAVESEGVRSARTPEGAPAEGGRRGERSTARTARRR